jgi:hypothetical protein
MSFIKRRLKKKTNKGYKKKTQKRIINKVQVKRAQIISIMIREIGRDLSKSIAEIIRRVIMRPRE